MEYRRFKDTVIIRMDPGEEILEEMQKVAEQEHIQLASVSALGATNDFTVGVFDPAEKKYYANHFTGNYEIVSLAGTINTMNGAYYAHLHLSAGNDKGQVFGGHLNRAVISATCEMVIRIIDGEVDRVFNEELGLNQYRFN
ncbi:MAG: DNA-binding protein [Solobacterium sp.]|nr:DNA-binding protein [Solobacterium sp.]